MGLRQIKAIVQKDFLEILRNKTVLVAIFLPLAVSLSLAVMENPSAPKGLDVGILGPDSYPLQVFLVASAGHKLRITHYQDLVRGTEAIINSDIDILLTKAPEGVNGRGEGQDFRFLAYVPAGAPDIQLAAREILEPALAAYLGQPFGRLLGFTTVTKGTPGEALLPLWLTITTVMVGVVILSGAFAEEKEKGTLDNIRISPVTPHRILAGKGLSGILLTLVPQTLMLAINRVAPSGAVGYVGLVLLLISGATVFTALGLLIGVFSKTQSAARAISTIAYFPLLFPAFTSDISPGMGRFALFTPSFYLYRGLTQTLAGGAPFQALRFDVLPLALFSVLCSGATLWGYNRKVLKEH